MKRWLLLVMVLVFSEVGYGLNMRIAPTGFAEDLSRPIARIVYVYNETNKPMRVMIGTEADERSSEYSLEENIKVFPKVMTIPPKGKRTARFRIDPKGLEDGEYKSYLYFQEMSEEKSREEMAKVEEGSGKIGVSLKMMTNMGIAIYGYVGEIVPGVNILEESLNRDREKWVLDVVGETTGNCSMTIIANVKYLDNQGKSLGEEVVSDRVSRGARENMRMVLANVPLEVSKIQVEYTNKKEELLASASYDLEI